MLNDLIALSRPLLWEVNIAPKLKAVLRLNLWSKNNYIQLSIAQASRAGRCIAHRFKKAKCISQFYGRTRSGLLIFCVQPFFASRWNDWLRMLAVPSLWLRETFVCSALKTCRKCVFFGMLIFGLPSCPENVVQNAWKRFSRARKSAFCKFESVFLKMSFNIGFNIKKTAWDFNRSL